MVVFFGTPETDANADRLIEEGRAEAERLGKEWQVLRIGWRSQSHIRRLDWAQLAQGHCVHHPQRGQACLVGLQRST